jgi:hypothetical protein
MSLAPRESPTTAFALSLLLHALVFLLVVTGLVSTGAGERARATLFRSPETVNFRFVELPENAASAKPVDQTDLVSERDTRAADHGPRDLPEGAPYGAGTSSVPEALQGQGGRGEQTGSPGPSLSSPAGQPSEGTLAEPQAHPSLTAEAQAATGELIREGGLGDRRLEMPRRELSVPQRPMTIGEGARGMPQVDNRLTRASYDGEFSLSTYEWDYAPYMRRLKRQIEDYTWTILPAAFWYGIAAWATQVRFVILPDGSLETILITGHEGVLDLRHVAPDAVTGAASFEPLPPGFPEPKLTITGNFYFNVFPPGREPDEAGDSP